MISTRLLLLGALLLFLQFSCVASPSYTLVDLTYPFDEQTIYWPGNKRFEWEKTAWGMTPKGYWYASANFAGSEHGGTHLDAPIHFAQNGYGVDEIPIQKFIGPAVVIDVRTQSQKNPDYELTRQDLMTWESQHGQIEKETLVLLLTGWGDYWPDKERYLGSSTPDDPATLHFPGFSAGAAMFLVNERRIRGIGIDTASIDPGQSADFPAHRILSHANLYALENVAGLAKLPTRGATVVSLPIKVRGGTGGPARIVALLP